MLSLLDVILNPYCDIPLIGVLRSPIASFTDDEVVIIRKCKKGKFYSALKEIVRQKNSDKLTEPDAVKAAEKAESFMENLKKWRSYSRYMSTDKLIWTLYEETDFYAFCGAMYDGETARANLRLLFLRAKQYEDNGFRGLFSFVKYMENLKKQETDLSSARLSGDSQDAVQLMTIHKSKGLEMPVVFVAACGAPLFAKRDSSKIVAHKDYGLGLDFINTEHRYKINTLEKKLIKSAILEEQTSEEIRKLYVAMTRAKEKLYVTATFAHDLEKGDSSEFAKKDIIWENRTDHNHPSMSPFDVLLSNCYADWVAPVARTSDNWQYRVIESSKLVKVEPPEKEEIYTPCDINVDELLSYEYPYKEATLLPAKVTVSQLKQKQETMMAPKPAFMQDNTETGAFYGTAMHNFLKYITYTDDMSLDYIQAQLDELTEKGIISEKESEKINTKKIQTFFESSIGKRILSAEKVVREQPFEVTLPANVLYPDTNGIQDENVILQGIIDCYFEEDGEIVLVDYKTDVYTSVDEIHQKYDLQLQLYATALSKITEKNVKNKIFYLFFDDSVLE